MPLDSFANAFRCPDIKNTLQRATDGYKRPQWALGKGIMEPDYNLAMAAGRDAADRNMRKNNRTSWSIEDWNLMCETMDKIMALIGE